MCQSRARRRVMADELTQLEEAAALSEMVYRRSQDDQRLDITGTDGTIPGNDLLLVDPNSPDPNNPVSLVPPNLTPDGTSGYYYDDSTGFVGRVVKDPSGTIY